MSNQIEELKKERERFVAFAFAAAEIFFEIDEKGKIVFEGGASERVSTKRQPLIGANIFERVVSDDRDIMIAMMEHLQHKGRLGPIPIRFKMDDSREVALRLFALHMPEGDSRTFLALRSAPLSSLSEDGVTVPETGLLTKDSFLELAQRTMQEDAGQVYVTAVEVNGIDEARERFGSQHADKLLKRIAAHLRTVALDGTVASQIGSKQFAFVHRAKGDGKQLAETLPKADSAVKLTTKSTTVSSDNAVAEGEVLRTLNFILSKFVEDPHSCDFATLANAYDGLAEETQRQMDQMRHTIETGNYKMAFQPIVSLADGNIHHHEVLSRFSTGGEDVSPVDRIKFAEDVGIIEEFDLSLCRKAIDYLRKMRRLGSHMTLSLNISGRTLDTGRLVPDLLELLMDAKDVSRSVILELTETKAILNLEKVEKILNDLKATGYRICLDDFGSGASGYQYLRTFNVDYVKIDGDYVKEMGKADYRPTFLLSMVRLCEDLGIKTIGEHVETRFQADFLRSLGVKYGQGFYFGRPTFSPKIDS